MSFLKAINIALTKPVDQGGLPGWAKGTIYAVGTAIVVFGLYKGYKFFNKDSEDKAKDNLVKDNDSEAAAALKKGLKYSYPASQYVAMANQMYEGMKYGIGDNYGQVRDTLKMAMNDLDVTMLVKAFGTRQAYVFGIPQGNPKDLFTMVKAELGNEYGGITSYKLDQVNEDWKKKGISYQI